MSDAAAEATELGLDGANGSQPSRPSPELCSADVPDEEMVLVPKSVADYMFASRATAQHRDIYFVQAVTVGLVKIGVADHAEDRLRALMMGCPDRLEVIGWLPCENFGKTEEALHRRFAQERAHGEWFRPSGRLLDWIYENATYNLGRMVLLQEILDKPNQPRGRKPKNADPREHWQKRKARESAMLTKLHASWRERHPLPPPEPRPRRPTTEERIMARIAARRPTAE